MQLDALHGCSDARVASQRNAVARLLRCDAVYYDAVAMGEPVQSLMQVGMATTRGIVAESDAGFLWDFRYPGFAARKLPAIGLLRRCCWKCRWFWVVRLRAKPSRCAIRVRTEEFRFLTGASTGRRWSAVITGGDLRRAAEAGRDPSLTSRTNSGWSAFLPGTIRAKSAMDFFGCT